MFRKSRKVSIFSLLCIIAIIALVSQVHPASAASTITINTGVTHQVIDGFGASTAFGIANSIHSLSNATTAMNDLFSLTSGAGLSIVRLDISPSFEPNSPGCPTCTPSYSWNGSDGNQVWFAQTAKTYGPMTIYADAWTAPAFMKTNNNQANGGFLCGESGSGATSCSSGDWRQAYANYLTQFAKDYNSVGVPLAYIGYINEPDFSPSYVSMNFDATTNLGGRGTLNTSMPQDIDFIKNYLGPTLKASGLPTKVSCCDATGWDNGLKYTSGILADSGASSNLALITSHTYYGTNPITQPMASNGQHSWETETSTFDTWNTAWDDGSDASGFTWAQYLWSALTKGNVNGYLYWWMAENNGSNGDNEGLLNLNNGTFTISYRLWAFGQYSRFVRPGATRIDASTSDANLNVSAFKNTDGTVAIVVLNGNTGSTSVSFSGLSGSSAQPYLTNNGNTIAKQSAIGVSGGAFSATIPARSLETFVISGTGSSATNTPVSATSTPGTESPFNGTRAAIPGKVEVENYDNGGEGVAYHDSDTTNQGGQYRTSDGVDIETTSDTGGGYDVGYTVAGEWLKYSVNVTTSGTYNIDFRVASTSASSFHLEVDGTNVTGTMTLPSTGAWQTFTTVTKSGVSLSAGNHVLRLYEEATNGNYNWINFSLASSGATNTPTFMPPTSTPGSGSTATPVPPTKTNTPAPTSSGSDPCSSPTVITGSGTFNVTTATTCFKYVNTSFVNGGMFTVMKDATSTSDTLKWYGGMDQNATSCANQSTTISGNGGQLDNFTVSKDANGQMFLIVTGAASNSVTITIQNWQNGTGCSVKPTVHP